jgi:hypothetical protein
MLLFLRVMLCLSVGAALGGIDATVSTMTMGRHGSRWLRALTSSSDISSSSSSSSTSSSKNIFYRSSAVVDTKNSYDGSKNSYNGSNGDDLYDDRSGGNIGIYTELEFIEYCQAWWVRQDDVVDNENMFISQKDFANFFVNVCEHFNDDDVPLFGCPAPTFDMLDTSIQLLFVQDICSNDEELPNDDLECLDTLKLSSEVFGYSVTQSQSDGCSVAALFRTICCELLGDITRVRLDSSGTLIIIHHLVVVVLNRKLIAIFLHSAFAETGCPAVPLIQASVDIPSRSPLSLIESLTTMPSVYPTSNFAVVVEASPAPTDEALTSTPGEDDPAPSEDTTTPDATTGSSSSGGGGVNNGNNNNGNPEDSKIPNQGEPPVNDTLLRARTRLPEAAIAGIMFGAGALCLVGLGSSHRMFMQAPTPLELESQEEEHDEADEDDDGSVSRLGMRGALSAADPSEFSLSPDLID